MDLIKSIHWDITRRCNLRCKHCYNAEKYFKKGSDTYIDRELSKDECLEAVDKFYQDGFRHIHFLGGEPLASPYLFDVIERSKELGMLITINSNAVLLTDEVQRKILDLKVDHFAASLDGASSKINDSIRGEGTFEQVCKNLKKFNELRKSRMDCLTETAIVFTLTKANLDDLKKLPKLAHELGVDLIALTTFIESGEGKNNRDSYGISMEIVCNEIENMVKQELIKFDIPLQIDMRPRICDYLSHRYNAKVIYNIKNSLCCAGEEMWYMEANGVVHPCLIFQLDSGKKALERGLYKKENIKIVENSILRIQQTEYWKTFLDLKKSFDVEKISTCKECRYADVCSPCFLDFGDYQNVVQECEWVKRRELDTYESIKNYSYELNEDIELRNVNKIFRNRELIMVLEDETSIDMLRLICANKYVYEIFENMKNKYDVDDTVLKYDIGVSVNLLENNFVIRRMRSHV